MLEIIQQRATLSPVLFQNLYLIGNGYIPRLLLFLRENVLWFNPLLLLMFYCTENYLEIKERENS